MYCILFVVLFLFLSINSEITVSTTEPSLEVTSDVPLTNSPTLTQLSSLWPIPSEDVSIWSTDSGELIDSRCIIPTGHDLDIIFVVDLSTNVYINELNTIKDIIENVLPNNSRAGLIIYSGCPRNFNFKQCKKRGFLKKIISLQNDMQLILNAVKSLQSGIYRYIRL